jgi:DNA-binding response OmpR family regulator
VSKTDYDLTNWRTLSGRRGDLGWPGYSRTMASVLVVEDDPTVAEVVTRYLEREGHAARAVGDGQAALDEATTSMPDLVVLDLMLPTIDGLEVCRRLRGLAPVPIIMLTARGEEDDRVLGLGLGADDYVTKPFSPRELTARVESVLRRSRSSATYVGPPGAEVLTFEGLRVDCAAREVTREGEAVLLTAKEFDLLAFMMRHPRYAFTRAELLERVWGYVYGDTSTVTVHVRRLREKLEPAPSAPRWIKTIWGVGYRFEP